MFKKAVCALFLAELGSGLARAGGNTTSYIPRLQTITLNLQLQAGASTVT